MSLTPQDLAHLSLISSHSPQPRVLEKAEAITVTLADFNGCRRLFSNELVNISDQGKKCLDEYPIIHE